MATGAGVSISAGTLRVAPDDGSEYRTLTISGTSNDWHSGVEILSSNTLVQAGSSTDMYINGRNADNGESQPTVGAERRLGRQPGLWHLRECQPRRRRVDLDQPDERGDGRRLGRGASPGRAIST